MPKRWHVRPHDRAAVAALEHSAGVSSIVAGLLTARGISDAATAKAFLSCTLADLRDPETLPGIPAAADRILDAEGVGPITLVSDGYHNARLQGIADELGMDAVTSPSTTGGSPAELARETGLVALGRVIGYGRMLRYRP